MNTDNVDDVDGWFQPMSWSLHMLMMLMVSCCLRLDLWIYHSLFFLGFTHLKVWLVYCSMQTHGMIRKCVTISPGTGSDWQSRDPISSKLPQQASVQRIEHWYLNSWNIHEHFTFVNIYIYIIRSLYIYTYIYIYIWSYVYRLNPLKLPGLCLPHRNRACNMAGTPYSVFWRLEHLSNMELAITLRFDKK
jgi:hypothetical protein